MTRKVVYKFFYCYYYYLLLKGGNVSLLRTGAHSRAHNGLFATLNSPQVLLQGASIGTINFCGTPDRWPSCLVPRKTSIHPQTATVLTPPLSCELRGGGGRLQLFSDKWDRVTSDHWVRDQLGYSLEFWKVPRDWFSQTHRLSCQIKYKNTLVASYRSYRASPRGSKRYGGCTPTGSQSPRVWRYQSDPQFQVAQQMNPTLGGKRQRRRNNLQENIYAHTMTCLQI